MIRTIHICLLGLLISVFAQAQESTEIIGTVLNNANGKTLSNVHVINLNSIKGAISDSNGEFRISAQVNDTLYFTFLGFEPQREVVKNDWITYGDISIEMTEVGIALAEVSVAKHKLTGYLEVDAKNIKTSTHNNRYSIAGLNDKSYEGTHTKNTKLNRVLKAALDPATSLYNIFSRKGKELGRLRKMKKDDKIRNLLEQKFDKESLTTLLQIDNFDLLEILKSCNYSTYFIETANDLQILDAISECYEEHRLLN